MTRLRVTVIQTDLAYGQPEANRRLIRSKLEQALAEKPDVIVWPEMWNTCYDLRRLPEIADQAGVPSIDELAGFARSHSVNLVAGSIADMVDNKAYNTTYVLDRQGNCPIRYSKIHLIGLMEEDRFITPGTTLGQFRVDGVPCGSIICYDLRFPELIRSLAIAGAEVLFVPAQWPTARLAHWRALLIARAIENQMYVVGANRTGSDPNNSYSGNSMVISPWGEVLYEAGSQEETFSVELDLGLIAEVRTKMPVFQDRVSSVYKL